MSTELVTTIYDHYKDTCSIIGNASKRRDRLMLWSLATLSLFSFELFFPAPAEKVFSSVIEKNIGIGGAVDAGLIGNVIWLGLLATTVRYYQTAAYVERLYPYIHGLEQRVNAALGQELITREGKSYLKDYPRFQDWLTFLYKKAMPALLVLIPTIKTYNEVKSVLSLQTWTTASFIIDIFVYCMFVWSTFRYVQMIHISGKNSDSPSSEAST